MNKKITFYNLWWLFAFPTLITCLLTAVSSFLTLNYEYLPAEIDFLSGFLYELSYIALDVALGFCLGAFCYALYARKALPALVTALVTLFNAGIMPMIMFFVRSVFLASTSSSEIMERYFSYDVFASEANILKMASALVISLAVMAVYFFCKIKKPIAKPYFLPKSEPAFCALLLSFFYLVYSTVMFVLGEDYDFIPLIMQTAYAVLSYFVIVWGVLIARKKYALEQTE